MASFRYFLFVERSGGPSKCPARSRTKSRHETFFLPLRPLLSVRSRLSRMTADFGTPRVAASCSTSRSRASGNLSETVVMSQKVIPVATFGNTRCLLQSLNRDLIDKPPNADILSDMKIFTVRDLD